MLMNESEFDNVINDAKGGLNSIVTEAEKFVNKDIIHGSFGGWNDVCGKKIGDMLISSVKDSFEKNINIFDCTSKLDKILGDIRPLISIIEDAKKELQ